MKAIIREEKGRTTERSSRSKSKQKCLVLSFLSLWWDKGSTAGLKALKSSREVYYICNCKSAEKCLIRVKSPRCSSLFIKIQYCVRNPGSASRRSAALVCCTCSLSKVEPELLEAVPWERLVSSGCVLCYTGRILCCLGVLWSSLTWMSLFLALSTRWSLGALWRNNFHMQT